MNNGRPTTFANVPQMSERRPSTICAIVERPDPHCFDNIVSFIWQKKTEAVQYNTVNPVNDKSNQTQHNADLCCYSQDSADDNVTSSHIKLIFHFFLRGGGTVYLVWFKYFSGLLLITTVMWSVLKMSFEILGWAKFTAMIRTAESRTVCDLWRRQDILRI